MRVQNTITVIVSKNYGHPLSLSLPVWRVYVGLTGLAALLVLLLVLSVAYVFTYQHVRRMEHETDELRKERDALREQVLSANREAFEAKEQAFLARLQGGGAGQERANAVSLRYAEEQYTPPVRVTAYTLRVNRRTVEVTFQLVNQGDAANNRGGFLYAIFENDDRTPVRYVPSPTVVTNSDGFPETYKMGVRFTRIRDTVDFRRKVRRDSDEAYFTHVTLYLFSVRGGLLLRERFELERDLFLKDQPAARTHQITSL